MPGNNESDYAIPITKDRDSRLMSAGVNRRPFTKQQFMRRSINEQSFKMAASNASIRNSTDLRNKAKTQSQSSFHKFSLRTEAKN